MTKYGYQLHEMRCKVRLNIENLENRNFEFFRIVRCSVQSEVKKIVLVKSSLYEVRLTRDAR